jgi:hypothetical protein
MKRTLVAATLSLTSLLGLSVAHAGQPTSQKLYPTPAIAARSIVAYKATRASGGAEIYHQHDLNAKLLGLSDGGKAKRYLVTGEGLSEKQSVLKVKGGWRGYK